MDTEAVLAVAEVIFAITVPPAAFIWWKRRTDVSVKPVFAGFAAYMFISFLRAVFRLLALDGVKGIEAVVISAVLSGVFEECGRYFVMRYPLNDCDRWQDSVSYGIGHGGAELFLGTVPPMMNDLLIGFETGSFQSGGSVFFAVYTLSSLLLHVSWSVLVFAAVFYRDGKKYLIIAVMTHILIDTIQGVLMIYSPMLIFVLSPVSAAIMTVMIRKYII